jgi:hypothetical protein
MVRVERLWAVVVVGFLVAACGGAADGQTPLVPLPAPVVAVTSAPPATPVTSNTPAAPTSQPR